MLIGKVVGSVVSTRKCENLVGNKFMIVDILEHMHSGADQLIAIDKIGTGQRGKNRKRYAGCADRRSDCGNY